MLRKEVQLNIQLWKRNLLKNIEKCGRKESKWRVGGLGWGVNNYWMHALSPGENFKFSAGWFDAFKRWHKIALRRRTNVCQQPPSNKIQALRRFHRDIRQKATSGNKDKMINLTGKFSLQQMANVDQTPLPFAFTDGQTYSEKGENLCGWEKTNQEWINDNALCRSHYLLMIYLE